MEKRNIKIFFIAITVIIAVAFWQLRNDMNSQEAFYNNEDNKNSEVASDWKEIKIKDVLSGEEFKISDFKGESVLLETFAVWCPTCLRQQKEIKKLKDEEGDGMVHISLDIDVNEDEEEIREHASENNLDWFFAISPADLTRKLIDDFGTTVVNAPSAPVVLICEDQSTRFLKRGVKSSEELREEINKGC